MQVKPINLNNLMSSAEFKKKVDYIRGVGEQRLFEAIWDNVYATYTPQYYTRTHELLNSVTSSVEYTSKSIIIKVFCDQTKMNHYSVIDGLPTYVGWLINDGFSWEGWEDQSPPDYFHNRPPSNFLEKAIKEIQQDMQKMLLDAIVVAFNNGKRY
jgi:hypothetical protein